MSTFLNLVVKDSPLESPFLPKEKRWVAAIASAVAAIGGAIIGNASNNATNNTNEDLNKENIKMQKETNALNAQLTRETNEQNYKMFQEQNAFNLDMWNKQNEYNLPAKEVQRLLAAGINPASKFGSAATASQLTSASPNAAIAPSMEAPKNEFQMRPSDFSGISESGIAAVNAYNASRMAAAETKNKDALTSNLTLDATFKAKTLQDSIQVLQNMVKKGGFEADIARRQLDFINATQEYDIQMKYGDFKMQQRSYEMLEKQMRYQDLQSDILEITKAYANDLNRAQLVSLWRGIHKIDAEIGLINANAMLTNEQRLSEIEKRVGITLDNSMKGVDNEIKKKTKEIVIQNAREDLYMKQDENRFYKPWNFYHSTIGRGAQFFPTPNASYGMQEYHFGRNGKQGIWDKRDRFAHGF